MRHRYHRFDVRLPLDVRIRIAIRADAERGVLAGTDFVVLRDAVAVGRQGDARAGGARGIEVAIEPRAALVLRAGDVPVREAAGLGLPELDPAEFQRGLA